MRTDNSHKYRRQACLCDIELMPVIVVVLDVLFYPATSFNPRSDIEAQMMRGLVFFMIVLPSV